MGISGLLRTELSLLVLLPSSCYLWNCVIGTVIRSAVCSVCASNWPYSAPRRPFGCACHTPDCAAARLSGVIKIWPLRGLLSIYKFISLVFLSRRDKISLTSYKRLKGAQCGVITETTNSSRRRELVLWSHTPTRRERHNMSDMLTNHFVCLQD